MADKWYIYKRGGLAVALSWQIVWRLGKLRSGGVVRWDVLVAVSGRVEYEKNLTTKAKDTLLLRLKARRFKTHEYNWTELWKELDDEQETEVGTAYCNLLTVGLPDRSDSAIPGSSYWAVFEGGREWKHRPRRGRYSL